MNKNMSPLSLLLISIVFYGAEFVANQVVPAGTQQDIIAGGLGTIGLICLLASVITLGHKFLTSQGKGKRK